MINTYCTYKKDGAKAGDKDCPCGGQCVCNTKS